MRTRLHYSFSSSLAKGADLDEKPPEWLLCSELRSNWDRTPPVSGLPCEEESDGGRGFKGGGGAYELRLLAVGGVPPPEGNPLPLAVDEGGWRE